MARRNEQNAVSTLVRLQENDGEKTRKRWSERPEQRAPWGFGEEISRGPQVDLSSQMMPNLPNNEQWKKTYSCLGYIGDGILHSYMIYGDYNRPIIRSLNKQLRENLHLTRFFWLWLFWRGYLWPFHGFLVTFIWVIKRSLGRKLVQSTTQKFNIPKMAIFKKRNMFQTKINWKLRSTDI